MPSSNQSQSPDYDISNYGLNVSFNFRELAYDVYELKSEIRALIRNTQQTENKVDSLVETSMATRSDLNTAINKLNSVLVTEAREIRDKIDSLESKINELNVPIDFSEEISRLNQAADTLESIIPSEPQAPITPAIIEEVISQEAQPPSDSEPPLTNDSLTDSNEPLEPALST